jgi:hypothetical protein
LEIPSNQFTSLLDTGQKSLAVEKLQTGQQLVAKVIEKLPNKTDVVIRLANQLIQVKADIPVSVGQTLKVLVEKNATEIVLKVAPPTSQQTDIVKATLLRQLLPKQTPVSEFQQPLNTLLSAINKKNTSEPSPQTNSQILNVATLKKLIVQINQALPSNKNITTASGLKNSLQNSGAFFEPKLQQALIDIKNSLGAQQQPNNLKALLAAQNNQAFDAKASLHKQPESTLNKASINPESIRLDLKANLIKLIQLLKSWPTQATSTTPQGVTKPNQASPSPLQTTIPTTPIINQNQVATKAPITTASPAIAQALESQIKELIAKSEGALSKITLNQLSSLNTETNSTRQSWLVEIPMLNNQQSESIFLKIEREESSSNKAKQADQQWTVFLEINPPKLGLIKSKLALSNDQINTSFWTENANTRLLINENLSLLRDKLHRANLQPESIQVQHDAGPSIQDLKPSSSILSEKA